MFNLNKISDAAHGVGVDFGTSNSVAATFDGREITLVQLGHSDVVMPSANYIDRDFSITTGQDAIDEYVAGNRGRKVELSAELLGEARTSTGTADGPSAESETTKIFGHAIHDASLPGRLFRGTKRLLGNRKGDRIPVLGRQFRLVALITPIIVEIKRAVSTVIKDVKRVCIGHPVRFEGSDPDRDHIALRRLKEAYVHAGFTEQSFCSEPVAAAISYIHRNPSASFERLLTLDFGGGTLDFCILQREGESFQVLATHGVALGGDKIDQTIFREVIFPLLGKGERWSRIVDGERIDTLFPFSEFEELLLNWPVSYILNQNKYTASVIQRMSQHDLAAEKFKRLYELISQNYSYQVFESIRACKIGLSKADSVILDIPEIDIEVEIERWEFECMISDILLELERSIDRVLLRAKLTPQDIDIVLRTGGSSLIPAVTDILDHKFSGKVVEHDPFTSVASGLAIADYFGLSDNGLQVVD